MLAEEAAKLPAKRWATIAPNYEYGQSAVAVFKKLLSAKRPGHRVGRRAVAAARARSTPAPVVQALDAAKPEAILNVTFGADLVKLVREGNTRGLFKGRSVVSFLTGEPEYLDPLKDETPEGWIVTGYPWYAIDTPEHDAFLERLSGEVQRLSAARLGRRLSRLMKAAAAILAKAGSTDPDKLIAAAEGLDGRHAVRPNRLPRHRPPVDDGRLRRQDRAEGRQGRDGRFRLSRRRRTTCRATTK